MPSWKINCLRSDDVNVLTTNIESPNTIETNNDDIHHLSSTITNHSFTSIKGRTTIELIKKDGCPLGLTISGGIDKDSKARVAQLKQGSIAHKADVLDTGDILIAINGIKTVNLKHEQIIDLIKQVDEQLILDIEYDLPKWPLHAINTVHTKTIQIQLEKEGQSYGFILRGGNSEDKVIARPLIVTKIRAQGPADKEGTLKIGDRVLAINGINVSGATLQEAHNLMRQCRGTTLFLIEYDVAIVDSIKHATGPLLIEIEKSPGSIIGINLTQKWLRNNRSIIVIDSVKPASIADRCGALHCGDQINAIDQKPFDGLSLMEANAILRSCTSDFCRIEVTPVNALASLNLLIEPTINRVTMNENNGQTYFSSPIQINNWTMRNNYQNFTRKSINKTRHNSISSLNSCYQTLLNNQMCHTEIMECILQIDSLILNRMSTDNESIVDFGFTIQGSAFNCDLLLQPPLISYLEPSGVAERSGILQVGDRILAINGQILEGMTVEEARSIIKRSQHQIHLEIEFDVTDSVMLSSGICQVKLYRKNLDLGLTVTYSRSSRSDDLPIISDVKRGSIAYRCGMIQIGDQLLSIDTHSLRGKSLNEIALLLKSCEDIVRLRIKKDDLYAEDNFSENIVVYKVQLFRQGGPLGLTISGSEDVFEPIIVSDLCEGGLADKTNAIHIGDRILAINDVSLRGKGLNEAIKLLQTSGEEITLKITRIINQQQKDYTPSVDSAMESWNSSNTDNRLSDHSDTTTTTTKETVGNDQQHYQVPTTNGSAFLLKNQILPIPIATTNINRSITVSPPLSVYRSPPAHRQIRQSDSERHISSVLNDKSIYAGKYDNYKRFRSQLDTITLVLKRDKRVLDFGFSISDRLYGTGVYVNKIRPNGPAELEGTLVPCMRIYKVNNLDVTRMECNQVVPLLSSSPDELTLVVGRRPAPMFDETDELYNIDENEDEHQSITHENGHNNSYSLLSQSKTSTV